MKSPYPTVSKKNPFLYVSVAGFDFSSVTTTGDTKLQVYRVNGTDTAINPIDYTPIEQTTTRYTFVFDSNLFDQAGGRYTGDFYYKGTLVSNVVFVYDKPKIQIKANV